MTQISSASATVRTFPLRFGRFVLLELLGEGGMGAVFRAQLEGPGGFRKACALKVLHPSVLVAARRLSIDLRTEARLGALLHHPNVVEIYDFGVHRGQPWVSMELVDGTELCDLLKGAGSPPPSVFLEMGLQLCSALEHAHGLTWEGQPVGFVHRDLKPSNVIVSRSGMAKITDFGIAKAAIITGMDTHTGVTKGTPSYMAPEQAQARPVDRRADLFALGAILYKVATGRRLFRGGSPAATVLEVLSADAVLEREGVLELADEAQPGLAGVLRRCLRQDPDERYDSAAELAEDLEILQLQAPPGPTLRRWLEGLPEQGAAFRGIRLRRRRFAAAADGPPVFDVKRHLVGIEEVDDEPPIHADDALDAILSAAGEHTWPSAEALSDANLDTDPYLVSQSIELPSRPQPSWLGPLKGAAAVLCGVGVGLLIGSSAWRTPGADGLEVEAPAPVVVFAAPSPVSGATAGAPGAEVAASRQELPADGRSSGSSVHDGPAGETLVVHAGAAAVGEAGEARGSRERRGAAGGASGEQGTDGARSGAARGAEDEVRAAGGAQLRADVEPDGEGAGPSGLVLTHPQRVERAAVGDRPSFIVNVRGEGVDFGALYVRVPGSPWEIHAMSEFSDGFWGTKLLLVPEMAGVVEYFFELRGPGLGADGVEVGSRERPFRARVSQ